MTIVHARTTLPKPMRKWQIPTVVSVIHLNVLTYDHSHSRIQLYALVYTPSPFITPLRIGVITCIRGEFDLILAQDSLGIYRTRTVSQHLFVHTVEYGRDDSPHVVSTRRSLGTRSNSSPEGCHPTPVSLRKTR